VVFDFDGVVCDSTDECFVTSWNAWERWNARPGFRTEMAEFDEQERRIFGSVRPRVRGAGEYYVLRRCISEGIAINSQEQYDRLMDGWRIHLDPFKEVFYECRAQLRTMNLTRWIALHPVFDGAIEVMRTLLLQARLYVATLKDADSVRLILESQGLKLPQDRLLDQSVIRSKLQALDMIRDRVGCDRQDMIFIDDNVTHLLDPHHAGYPVALTSWGPLLSEYLDIARSVRIRILSDTSELHALVSLRSGSD
jgi:phosphoglycolate phosphatase-like HAD superfamily hydrolase